MNLKNTNDIKKAVLQHCGELTDGTSPYDSVALSYINRSYKALFGGGDIFGVDCSEPWPWARSKRAIILRLETEITAGSVTLTNGSFNGTFSQVPKIQLNNSNTLPDANCTNWYLKLPNYDDYFQIRQHNAGELTFQLDQQWFDGSQTSEFTLFTVEYELFDDTILVDDYSMYLDFSDGSNKSATLAKGIYTTADFCTLISSTLSGLSADTITLAYNSVTRLFQLSTSGTALSILGSSGSHSAQSAWKLMGFGASDYSGATSYVADQSLNAIQRLIAPINTYRNVSPRFIAPEDSGKIYGIDINSMYRKYPMTQMYPFYPDKFAEMFRRDNGSVRIRINTYPREAIRAEINYIPVAEVLYDNTSSVPAITEPYRAYLVYAAAYYLFKDKSDDRLASAEAEAKAMLTAMINDYRSNTELTNNQFGKIIPRAVQYRPWRIIP